MQAYRAEKERLADKANADDGGAMDFGPGLTFDEKDAVAGSLNAPQIQIPKPRAPKANFDIYDPSKRQE
jgi:hypothetical protein